MSNSHNEWNKWGWGLGPDDLDVLTESSREFFNEYNILPRNERWAKLRCAYLERARFYRRSGQRHAHRLAQLDLVVLRRIR